MTRLIAFALVFTLIAMIISPAYASPAPIKVKEPMVRQHPVQQLNVKLLSQERVTEIQPVVNAFREGLKDPKAAKETFKAVQSQLQSTRPIAFINGYWVVPVDMSRAYSHPTVKSAISKNLKGTSLNTFDSLMVQTKGTSKPLPENIFVMFVSSTIAPQLGLGPKNGYPDYVTGLMPDIGFGPGLIDRGKINQGFFDKGLPENGFFNPDFVGGLDDLLDIGILDDVSGSGGGSLGGLGWGDAGSICGSVIGTWLGSLIGGTIGAMIGAAIGQAVESLVNLIVGWLTDDEDENSNDANADSDKDGTPNGEDGSPNDSDDEEEPVEGIVDPCWQGGCSGNALPFEYGICFADSQASEIFTSLLASYFTADQMIRTSDASLFDMNIGTDFNIKFGF